MNWENDLIDDIVVNINNNRIVPLIGPGAFYIHETDEDISVQQYLVRESLKKIRGEEYLLNESDILKYNCGYKGMTNLNKEYVNSTKNLHKQIKNILLSSDFNNKLKIKPLVKEFIQLGDFPLVLTTCVFRNIERLFPKYNGIPYQLGQGTDQSIPDDVIKNPCVFYLFGYLDAFIEESVLTEKDYLKFLYFIQDSDNGPRKLKNYLSPKRSDKRKEGLHSNEKYLLSLGCDIPDWTYRFLIYSLKEHDGDLTYQVRKDDTFVGGITSTHIDEDFDDFLASIGYYSAENLDEVLRSLISKIKTIPKISKPTLFLSVNSDEYQDVSNLKNELEKHFEVWFFKDKGRNKYFDSIQEGLDESMYFMPIVSKTTILKMYQTKPDDYGKRDTEIGIITEMRMALEQKNKRTDAKAYCIPVYHNTNKKELFDALDQSCNELKPLFEGIQGIETPLDEITSQQIIEYIENC